MAKKSSLRAKAATIALKGRKSSARKSPEKDWIGGAIKNPGALHRDLGVPEGKKIPVDLIEKAAKRKDKVGSRARLALTLRGFNKK
jgi:hypothetical protein